MTSHPGLSINKLYGGPSRSLMGGRARFLLETARRVAEDLISFYMTAYISIIATALAEALLLERCAPGRRPRLSLP